MTSLSATFSPSTSEREFLRGKDAVRGRGQHVDDVEGVRHVGPAANDHAASLDAGFRSDFPFDHVVYAGLIRIRYCLTVTSRNAGMSLRVQR